MGAAPLPARTREGGDQAAVGVGGDQGDHGEAADGQVAEERQPAGAVLGGADVDTEDLPVPVGVHPGRSQHVHMHDPAAFADLHRQRIRREERVRAGVQRPAAEVRDQHVQLGGHHRDLRLPQPGDPQRLDQPFHPPGSR